MQSVKRNGVVRRERPTKRRRRSLSAAARAWPFAALGSADHAPQATRSANEALMLLPLVGVVVGYQKPQPGLPGAVLLDTTVVSPIDP
jgi:hypothetical protein